MAKCFVTFTSGELHSQEAGNENPDKDYLVGRIYFDLDVDGRLFAGQYVDIGQPAGTVFEGDPIEVGFPKGSYSGLAFSHAQFSEAAEEYFRMLFGAGGSGIDVSGSTGVSLGDNVVHRRIGPVGIDFPGT